MTAWDGVYQMEKSDQVEIKKAGTETDKPNVYVTPSFIDEIKQRNRFEMEKYKKNRKDERNRQIVRYYLKDVYRYAYCSMETRVSKLSEKEFSTQLRNANRRYLARFIATMSWPVGSIVGMGAGIWLGSAWSYEGIIIVSAIMGICSAVLGFCLSPFKKYYKILKYGKDV